VAADGSATNQRGTFEVLNPGSEFTLTGGDFTIRRGTNSNSVPSLRLDPTVYDLTGSTVTIGDASTNSPATPFGIRSTIPFNNLTIDDSSDDLPTVQLISNDLIVQNNFSITNGAVFNSNGFDVTIQGDFINGAGSTYTNNNANTILEGTSTLSGAGTFTIHDLTKIGDNTTSTVGVDITVSNDLFVTNGTLDLGPNDLDLKRDATIQDTITVSGTSGGIVFSGLGDQNIFGKTNTSIPIGALTINNGAEVEVEQGNGYNFAITDTLRMEGGVFDIGGSLLTIGQQAGIKEVSTFSATNSIQTNSSFTDNGVLKIFNGTEDDFFFPVGETKYTPVAISINSNSLLAGDSILIRPANEFHPSILSDDETMEAGMPTGDPALTDTTNVLNYYWIVLANDVTDFTGSITFNFLGEDAGIDNDFDDNGFDETSYDTTYYAPARLIKSSLLWDKAYGTDDYDGASEQMTFTFSSAQTDEQLSGDYTAGIYRDPNNSDEEIKGSIPDAVPTYIFTPIGGELGDYTVANNWTPVGTSPVPTDGVGPVGALITINAGDTLDLNRTGIRLLTTVISSGAVLRVNGNVINRLGGIEGTGTIILEDAGDLPAGFYSDFFTCDGGALVYDGTTDYSVLGGIPQIRRVDFSGSGTRIFPNNSLEVCDTLSVNGPTISFNQGNSLDIEDRFELNSGIFGISNSSDMLVRGDFVVNGGTFTGNSTADIELRDSLIYRGGSLDFNQAPVSLTGSATQYIEGDVTFQRLIVNNTGGGIDIRDDGDNDVIITTAITFTDGIVRTGDGDTLVLNANATYSDVSNASFVRGPVKKLDITAGSNYTFPVGDVDATKAPNGVYSPVRIVGVGTGGQDWYAQFFFGSQQDNTLFDATDPGSGQNSLTGIFDLSWKVASTGANTSKVELYYQSNYGNYSDNNDLRVALWDRPDQEYKNQGGIVVGSNSSGVVISENTIHFSENDLALGSAPEDTTPLPVEMLYFTGVDDKGAVDLDWATATEINNEYFEVQRSQDGKDWEVIGVVMGAGTTVEEQVYDFTDFKPYVGNSYYRLRQVDYDGQFAFTDIILVNVRLEPISFNVYPNPVRDVFTVDIKGINANEETPYTIISLQGAYVGQGVLRADEAGRISEQLSLNYGQPAGIYILRVESSQRVLRFNLIKK
ncbi:MAG: T9SS type A sorting domain-containing protein, partial [Cyclobacteriaceae bacterium]